MTAYHLMEKTDNAPRKNTFPSPHSWPSAGVRCFFSSSFHTRPLWECVWKEEEKSTPTPALCQEWEEGNVFFLGALSVFSTWGFSFKWTNFFFKTPLEIVCHQLDKFFNIISKLFGFTCSIGNMVACIHIVLKICSVPTTDIHTGAYIK